MESMMLVCRVSLAFVMGALSACRPPSPSIDIRDSGLSATPSLAAATPRRPIWTTTIVAHPDGLGYVDVRDIAVLDDGRIYLGATRPISLPGREAPPAERESEAVTELSRDGELSRSSAFPADIHAAAHFAADQAGNVVVAGSAVAARGAPSVPTSPLAASAVHPEGHPPSAAAASARLIPPPPFPIGGGPRTPPPIERTPLLVKLDRQGGRVWSIDIPVEPRQIVTDRSGSIALVGSSPHEPVTFAGGHPVLSDNAFIVKLDPSGAFVWATTSTNDPSDIAVDDGGNVFVQGWLYDEVTIGAKTLRRARAGHDEAATSDDHARYVAKLDASGRALWLTEVVGTGMGPWPITVDCAGNVVVTSVSGEATGAETLMLRVRLQKLDPAGRALWQAEVQIEGTQHAMRSSFQAKVGATVIDCSGETTLAINYAGTLRVGSKVMPSAGKHDYAIVRFAPTGAVLWSERYGGTENEQVIHLGADREGDPVIVSYVGPALFEPDVPSSGPEASRWVITKLPR